MPRGDGTGPGGMGSMTGRAAGYCAGYQEPGFANPISGRGYGVGFGRGRGMGFGFRGGRGGRWAVPYAGYGYSAPYAMPYGASPTREQSIEALKGQASYFANSLAQIQKRIDELETKAPKE